MTLGSLVPSRATLPPQEELAHSLATAMALLRRLGLEPYYLDTLLHLSGRRHEDVLQWAKVAQDGLAQVLHKATQHVVPDWQLPDKVLFCKLLSSIVPHITDEPAHMSWILTQALPSLILRRDQMMQSRNPLYGIDHARPGPYNRRP